MFDHLSPHMRTAGELLTSQDSPLQVRLVEAGNELWAALAHPEEWPPDLLKRAKRLLDRLLAGGTLETTVAQMDFETVQEIAQGILDLVAEVEAIRSERLHPSRSRESLFP